MLYGVMPLGMVFIRRPLCPHSKALLEVYSFM
jgi:hypothetical protein